MVENNQTAQGPSRTLARSARGHIGEELRDNGAPRPLRKAPQTCARARFRGKRWNDARIMDSVGARCSTGCFPVKRCTQRANRAAARVLGSFLLRRELGIPGIRTQSRQLTLARSARDHIGMEFGHDEAPRPLQKATQTCATARFRKLARFLVKSAKFNGIS